MTDEQYQKRILALESDACQARGHIIHRVTQLEMTTNLLLAKHFAKDKDTANEMLSFLFCTNRITFEYKNQIFALVVDKHYPSFKKAKPNFKDDLGKIAAVRNQFAHLFIDVTESGIEKTNIVALAKWKGEQIVVHNYTKKSINDIVEMIYSYNAEITKLLEE